MKPEDKASLVDVLLAAERISRYLIGVDRETFLVTEEKRSAVYGEMVMLGEASTRLSDELIQENSHIPWRQIIGMRHRIIHAYDEVNWQIVWQIATHDVPDLISQVRAILSDDHIEHEND
jgi:uncharacterized protein with HEPN domain